MTLRVPDVRNPNRHVAILVTSRRQVEQSDYLSRVFHALEPWQQAELNRQADATQQFQFSDLLRRNPQATHAWLLEVTSQTSAPRQPIRQPPRTHRPIPHRTTHPHRSPPTPQGTNQKLSNPRSPQTLHKPAPTPKLGTSTKLGTPTKKTVPNWASRLKTGPTSSTPSPSKKMTVISVHKPGPPPFVPGLSWSDKKREETFQRWLSARVAQVRGHTDLSFYCGVSSRLKDGTISLPIWMRCRQWGPRRASRTPTGQEKLWGTDFYFHFHPGASGARMGSTESSRGHFKPQDGGHVRLKRASCTGFEDLYASALDAARNRTRNSTLKVHGI